MTDPISSALAAWAAKKLADTALGTARRKRLRDNDDPQVRRSLLVVVRAGVDDALERIFPSDTEQQYHVRALLLERDEDDLPLVDGTYPADLPAAVQEWVFWIESPPSDDGGPETTPEDHPFTVELSIAILNRLRHAATRGEQVLANLWMDFKTHTGLDRQATLGNSTRVLEFWNPTSRGVKLVGRESDLEALADALGTGDGIGRVQSVGGLAGIGKTALAVSYGEHTRDRYPDGRIFYDFDSYTTGHAPRTAAEALAQILPTIHPDLTIGEVKNLSLDELVSAWRQCTWARRLLMVWDNVRQADQIAPLLLCQDGCGTIITSRDAITIEGHTVTLWLDALSESDAIALFAQIAGRDHPKSEVSELVRRDLCVPVLIQAHATAVASGRYHLSEVIADLPETPRSPAPRSQEQLFERLDGSYRHLTDDQRFAFRAFGAHPGRFVTIESLGAMLGCDLTEAGELMNDLFDAGLVTRHHHRPHRSEEALRSYTAHDLLRTYASYKAEQAGDLDQLKHALVVCYLRKLATPDDNHPAWLATEVDNIRETALNGRSSAHAELAMRVTNLTWAATPFSMLRNFYRHALSIAESNGDQQQVIRALIGLGDAAPIFEDGGRLSVQFHEQAVDLAKAIEDESLYMSAQNSLARSYCLRDEYDTAIAHHRIAFDLAVSLSNFHEKFFAQRGFGFVAQRKGETSDAIKYYRAALELADEAGQQRYIVFALSSLLGIAEKSDDWSSVLDYHRRKIELLEDIGDKSELAHEIGWLAGKLRNTGEKEAALDLYRRSISIFEELGDWDNLSRQIETAAELEGEQNHPEAARLYQRSLEIRTQLDDMSGIASVYSKLSEIARVAGDSQLAFDHAKHAVEFAERTNPPYHLVMSLNQLARIAKLLQDQDSVIECRRRIVSIYAAADKKIDYADALSDLGRELLNSGFSEGASQCFSEAIDIYVNLGDEGVGRARLMADMMCRSNDFKAAARCFRHLAHFYDDLAEQQMM